MNKQAVIAIAVLGLTGYSYAEERIENEAVQVTLEVRVDKDIADEVVAEAKKDASILKEKYDSVCGIDAVRTVVKRGIKKEEEITRSCSSSCKCKCKCKSCSNGRCCNCRSVTIDDACSCEAQPDAEGTRAVCEACEKIKEGNERKRQRQRELQQQQQNKSVRTLKENNEFCDCQIVHQKCPDCGNETSEFRCACGRPNPTGAEDAVRCNCGSNKPKPDAEQ
ncbi:hypothetical protein E3J61_02995 [Candidatus Dependentiae bacterium]|nr:MAG: hypothetical protein E3J61_02995 [Candidatus Dependentiae bacterium]